MLCFERQDDSRQRYFVYVPASGGLGAPVFVAVHGATRNTHELAFAFSCHCEELGVVLVAPHFAEPQFRGYQRLERVGGGPPADAALDSILDEVERLTGADASRIHLCGISGGAQFAHRYTMAHPRRVARSVLVSAGWYTFPDPRRRFPYGIRASRHFADLRFDPEEFLRVPIAVFVGDRDTTGEQLLRRTKRVNRQQGTTRMTRARNWVAAMRAAANAYHLDPLVSFEAIAGGHSFLSLVQTGQLAHRVFASLLGDGARRAEPVSHA